MDNFIQITVICPLEPRVGAFVYWNVGKVYYYHALCFVRDLTSEDKLFGLRVTLTTSEKFSTYIFRIFCVRKNVIISLRVFSLFQRTSRFNGMRFLASLHVDDCH